MSENDYEAQTELMREQRAESEGLSPDAPCFEHVRVAGYKHFLVVDGTRGPVVDDFQPAMHPAGWVYFHQQVMNTHHSLKGKLLRIVTDHAVNLVDDSKCELAQKAFTEYAELSKMCGEIKASHYPEATA